MTSGHRRHHRVEAPGATLSIETSGSGPPLVLLHPLALAGRIWGDFGRRLAQQRRLICPDARGHGASTWDGNAFTIEDLAEDVKTVVDALGIDAVDVLGMSMGGSTGLVFAGRYPDRVRRLVLADTTAWYGPGAARAWEERAERVLAVPRGDQVAFQLDRWFSDGLAGREPGTAQRAVGIFLGTSSAAHSAACRALGALDARGLLRAITAPALVLAGENDYATPPEMGRLIAAGTRDGTFELLPGLRHLSLLERPSLAARVLGHLAGQEEAAPR